MKIKIAITTLLWVLSFRVYAVGTCEVVFTLSGGGTGSVSYTVPDASSCPSNNFLSNLNNLAITFSIGSVSWNQSHLTAKHDIGFPPYQSLFFGGPNNDAYWDDTENGSGDSAIVTFTNGTNILIFDEGDEGARSFNFNGNQGTYTAIVRFRAALGEPIPTLSEWGMILMTLLLSGALAWQRLGQRVIAGKYAKLRFRGF